MAPRSAWKRGSMKGSVDDVKKVMVDVMKKGGIDGNGQTLVEETECGDEGPRADLEEADLSVDDNERDVLAAVCGACEVSVSVCETRGWGNADHLMVE